MSNAEVISSVIAGLALLVSIVAIVVSARATKLTHAQVEISVYEMITASQERVQDFYEKHLPTAEPAEKKRHLQILMNSLIEKHLGALDMACQKYIDGKIDKVRFKKAYQREIRQVVQDESHKEFFGIGHAYNALMLVYTEWENPESL